jgi:hypothetical protein
MEIQPQNLKIRAKKGQKSDSRKVIQYLLTYRRHKNQTRFGPFRSEGSPGGKVPKSVRNLREIPPGPLEIQSVPAREAECLNRLCHGIEVVAVKVCRWRPQESVEKQ